MGGEIAVFGEGDGGCGGIDVSQFATGADWVGGGGGVRVEIGFAVGVVGCDVASHWGERGGHGLEGT